ncbi:MAG: hypothetical protein AUI14_16235 [Actinobacteria bacterium 13_2_20CM_2_71_6]|nr:MAG: hypothetical protein AUI14_16235 [Actinobacteria bacterium 13_2_20CM_2_71_6]
MEPSVPQIQALTRSVSLTTEQWEIVNEVRSAPSPHRTLRSLLDSPNMKARLIDAFGGREPTVEEIHALTANPRVTRQQMRLLSEVLTSPRQKAALQQILTRTSYAYSTMVKSFGGRYPTVADMEARMRLLDEALGRPIPANVVAHRGLRNVNFLPEFRASGDLRSLVGTTQTEPGYMSTSLGARPAFGPEWGYHYRVHLAVPRGASGLWVGFAAMPPFNRQRELILARGTSYRILEIRGLERNRGNRREVDIFAEVLLRSRA